ncbi:MAG: translation initiation factor IF-2 subunit alpha [Thermoplasmata archaeon]
MPEEEVDYEWPTEGELVLGNVQTVKDFGAFIELEEYEGKIGFIHISEISSGWVKRIRDYIREGQKRVCKVLRVDKRQAHIDLSLKQVNEHQRREKLQAWKNHQKAEKLLSLVAEELDKTIDECYDEFAYDLIETMGSLYEAFEECTLNKDALKKAGFQGEWVDVFTRIARDNISPPYISIMGYLKLSSRRENGVDHIKEALSTFGDVGGSKVEVSYMASPKYRVDIRSTDYKIAEEIFEDQAQRAVEMIEERGGKGEFYRKES